MDSQIEETGEPPSKKLKKQDDGSSAGREGFEPVAAASTVSIRLVDVAKGGVESLDYSFHPEYMHQIFGEEEEINGYSGLNVQITMDVNTFYSHVGWLRETEIRLCICLFVE